MPSPDRVFRRLPLVSAIFREKSRKAFHIEAFYSVFYRKYSFIYKLKALEVRSF